MNAELKSKFTAVQTAAVDSFRTDALTGELDGIRESRISLDQELKLLRIELCENLVKRRGDTLRRIQDLQENDADVGIELEAVGQRLRAIDARLEEINGMDSFSLLESCQAQLETLEVFCDLCRLFNNKTKQ